MHCDLLIDARWIIPVLPKGLVLEHAAIAVNADKIVGLGGTVEMLGRWQPNARISLPDHALMPGLVNAHAHVAMNLMRGLADDLPLMTWLNDYIWPAEGRYVSAEFVRDGAELAIAEMLQGGITAFQDMYFFSDVVAATAARMGMRAITGAVVIEYPSAYGQNVDRYFELAEQQILQYRDHALVHVALSPHAPYTVADASFERVREMSERLQARVYCHVHETADEVEQSLREHGVRPLARLERLGVLNARFTAVHMTQLLDAEIANVAERGVHVAHCPESNLKLASGFCPVAKLLAAGVNVALGTDGAASNNDLDLLGEMKTAALLAKAVAQNASAFSASEALYAATMGGAHALGLADKIGSLEVGKSADLIALRMDELDSLPVYSPVSQIVYTNHRRQVTDVWIAGKRKLAAGLLVDVDVPRIRANAVQWGDKIRSGNLA